MKGSVWTIATIFRLNKRIPRLLYSNAKKTDSEKSHELIFKQINQLNAVSELKNSNLKNISMLLECVNEVQRISMVKYVMATLYNNKSISLESLKDNEVINEMIEEYPFVKLEMIMMLIAKKKLEQNASHQINDLYLECYHRILPQAKDHERLKVQALFYKNFGKHLLENKATQKGFQALEKSLELQQKLIIEEYKKLQAFNKNREKNQAPDQQTKQKQKLQANAMKENIRRLLESMFETLHFYYEIKKKQIRTGQSADREKTIVNLLALINSSMKVKSMIPGFQSYSRFYHRLMQISYELEYAFALMKKDEKKVKKIRATMRQFKKQSLNDLQSIGEYPDIQKEVALAIMSLQLHLSRSETSEESQVMEDLVSCSQLILEKGQLGNKSAKAHMTKLLAQFIKKNCPVEIK